MGGALATAVAKTVSPQNILLADATEEKASALAKALSARVSCAKQIAQDCDFIFLGVKPQNYSTLFDEIAPIIAKKTEKTTLISMAAGISIKAVEQLAGTPVGVIRIMPNTPVAVGEGMILYDVNSAVTADALDAFVSSMQKAGVLDRIPEHLIDAASALSGCGPAFVYLFAEALSDGAVECGLPRDKALAYAAQTLMGAAKMLQESGKGPGELKDAVCSPGGTTIAGVHALESGAFRATAMGAVTAAYEKTLKLKK